MGSGYVLNFTNATFARFIHDVCNIDIYNGPNYKEDASKANKLRQIWEKEDDPLVGNLINALLDEYIDYKKRTSGYQQSDQQTVDEMRIVATRLIGRTLRLNTTLPKEETLSTLREDINNALSRNKPTLVLDRLHTFSTKFLREICENLSIPVSDNKGTNFPLQSLAGMLKKHYEQKPIFGSAFVPLAIRNSIGLFDEFNAIRNNQSYAHDNTVLGDIEAEFVVRTMINIISFIDAVERKKNNHKHFTTRVHDMFK